MPPQCPSDLDSLYLEHNGWLRHLLYRRLGCSETASDLAHDTFLRLLRRDEDPQRIDRPRAYLKSIALGLLANHWRRREIEQAYLEALRRQPEATVQSPETRREILQTLYRIDTLLRELPGKVRRAFLLSRLEGWRYADIAVQLGVSERMVKKYMSQAMLHCLRREDAPSDG